MPTAAAVAAAAATAKIQALDAVASNAVLGLSQNTPVMAAGAVVTKVGAMPVVSAATSAAALHPALAQAAPALLPPGIFQAPSPVAPSLLGVPAGLQPLQPVVFYFSLFITEQCKMCVTLLQVSYRAPNSWKSNTKTAPKVAYNF